MLGKPLSDWTCTKIPIQSDSIKIQTPYTSGGTWEFLIADTLDSLPANIYFTAPDLLLFELTLNGKPLIENDNYTVWPSTFSSDSIFIYPSSMQVRPFVIDAQIFKSLWRAGENKIVLRIKGKNTEVFDASKCALYFFTSDARRIENHFHHSSSHFSNAKLPTVLLNSDKYTIPNEPKVNGTLELICNEEKDCEKIYRNIKIEVRGFSSSSYDKKQYTFTIANDSAKKEKVTLLEMNAARRWILQGPYSDPSLVRNAFVYEMWRQMGYWSAQSRYVELVLNGTYQGVYLIMEKVEVNKARLNLKVDTVNTNSFLIQLNRNKEGDDIIQDRDLMFILSDLPGMNKNDTYKSRVHEQISSATDAMRTPMQHQDLVDVNSIADFILVQEMVKNVDAYKVSTYFHKDDNSKDKRFKAGPVWDFDLTMGSSTIARGEATDGWIYPTDKSIPYFFKNKFDDPAFSALLAERYRLLRATVWSEKNIWNVMDSLVDDIGKDAITRNFIRFPVLGQTNFLNQKKVSSTHADEIVKMKTWMHARLEWMDEYFGVQTTAL